MRPCPRAATSLRNSASESVSLPEADHAGRDANRRERLKQALIVARLLGIRRVGEQHDVPRPLVGFLHHLRGVHERGVGEDAAAHRLNAPDLVADLILVFRRRQRTDDVRGAVHGDDANLVVRPERLDRGARPQIGEVHLRAAGAGGHRHAPGPIEHHGHRERELAMFVLQLHRDGQMRIEDRLEIAADAERSGSAREQQAAAEVGGEAREPGERLRPD